MSQVFQCPLCESQLGIPDVLVGKEVRCGACSTVFVAGSDGVSRQAEAPPSPPATAPPQPLESEARTEPLVPPPLAPEQEQDFEDRPRRRRRTGLAPHRGSTVLAVGILSFFFLRIILGPLAWSMGHHDLREMREGRMDPEGEGATRAGYICGIITTSLTLVMLAVVALLVLFMAISESMKN